MERLFWVCFTDLQDTLIFANDIHYGRILECWLPHWVHPDSSAPRRLVAALLVASVTITTSFVLPLPLYPVGQAVYQNAETSIIETFLGPQASFVDHLPTVWRSWDSYAP
ncbi:hypothetical protein PM082_023417 [Marasmius tenuissimus]|nr:hypothetical protein PM082_023417 [Marasmius tenuissimus]